jgi:hypothetical protein
LTSYTTSNCAAGTQAANGATSGTNNVCDSIGGSGGSGSFLVECTTPTQGSSYISKLYSDNTCSTLVTSWTGVGDGATCTAVTANGQTEGFLVNCNSALSKVNVNSMLVLLLASVATWMISRNV